MISNHKTLKTMQNLLNIDESAVNGSQLLAVATPERSRLATFHAKEMFCGFCEFCDKKINMSVFWQTLRAARTNPAEALKKE